MIYVTFVLAGLGEIALPVVIMVWLKRRYGVSWKLFGVGVLTFIASQVVHIPLLGVVTQPLKYQLPPYAAGYAAILLEAVLLGLLAGLCEETSRLVGYWILKGRAKTFEAALTLGTGHGGIESIGVAVSLLATLVVSLLALHSNQAVAGETPKIAATVLASPWYIPLVSLFERFTAVSFHITLSVMVWYAFTRRAWSWYFGAVLYHTFVDALAVALPLLGVSTYLLEGILGVFMLANLRALYLVNGREKRETAAETSIDT